MTPAGPDPRETRREIEELHANFTSMLVHDLRSPLSVIRGYAELIARGMAGPVTEKQRHYLEKVLASCDQMMRLIAETLDFSRLEAGRLTLNLQPTDVAAVAAEVVERLGPLAAEQGISLGLRGDGPARPLDADPDRLEHVLLNLVGNALKFTPAGGSVTVEIADLGEEVEVAVRDTGLGIAPDELRGLFERFSPERAGRVAQKGTGLGLLVCRDLVAAHGGRIWAESGVGSGSRFAFRLPRRGGVPREAPRAPGEDGHGR